MQQADQCVCVHPGFDADLRPERCLLIVLFKHPFQHDGFEAGLQGEGERWDLSGVWQVHIPELDKSTTQLGDRLAQVPVMPFLMATDTKIVKVS